jgi:SpoVK/Ycf46/Vps4 family AAA+-type ATPase
MVYQIARETNRELMKVDISQSKSMWFGESEKVIKRIFTDYYAYAKKCKVTPILLFNEADAIISKRRAKRNFY